MSHSSPSNLNNEQSDEPGMQYEENRLNTFSKWPSNAAVDFRRIAKAGFFFTGPNLGVQCFCCGKKIDEWNYGDQVMTKHRKLSPQCPFVQDPNGSGNVPFTNVTHMGSFLSTSSQSEGRRTVDSANSNESGSSSRQPNTTTFSFPSTTTSVSLDEDVRSNNASQEPSSLSKGPLESQSPALNSELSSLRRERDRLRTFDGWPVPFLRPEIMAQNGFFYTREGDTVRCAFCSGAIGQWEDGDDPVSDHRKHFPRCPFVCGLEVGNVPLDQEDSSESTDRIYTGARTNVEDNASVGAVTNVEVRPFSAHERSQFNNRPLGTTRGSGDIVEVLGITRHRGPKNPSYATVEARLRTFAKWPPNVQQTPEDMAAAGFYYMGDSDHVRCFHCDGGLRHWEPSDDPWQEHGRWFSHCAFVLLVKGDDFVRKCVEEAPPVIPPLSETRNIQPTRQEPPRPTSHIRQVTDEELVGLMGTPHAIAALQIGIDPSRIKRALRQKMEQTGLPFTTVDALIESCLDLQMGETRIAEIEQESLDEEVFYSIPIRRAVRGPPPSLQDQASQQPHSPHHTSLSDISKVAPLLSNPNTNASVMAFPVLGGSVQSLPGSLVNCSVSKENLCGQSPQTLGGLTTSKSMPQILQGKNVKGDASQESLALEEENRLLKEARLCKVCMDEEVGVVFLPCGHLITCVQCAPALGDCPMCRQPIRGAVRTFLS